MRRSSPSCGLWILTFVICTASTSLVFARDDLSGSWKEDYSETIYQVEQWGQSCGEIPQSQGRTVRNLQFTVEDRGVDLIFKDASGKSFSTAGCQSDNPKSKAKERTLKDELFLVSCATPETDNPYESGLYSFRVKSATLVEYRETSRFSRNVGGALCVHTRRIQRSYTRLAQTPKPEPEKPKDPEPALQPKPVDPCARPGKAVRMSLDPASARAAPLSEICLTVSASDAQGCPTPAALAWGAGKAPADIHLIAGNCVMIGDRARPGTHRLSLAVGDARAVFTLEVSGAVPVVKTKPPKPAPAAPAIPAPEQPPAAPIEVPDAGVAAPAVEETKPAPIDAGPAPALPAPEVTAPQASPASAPYLLYAILGGGGLILIGVALLLVLRRRMPAPPAPKQAASAPDPQQFAQVAQQEKIAKTMIFTSPDLVAQGFCTTCGKAIPRESKFCPYDRTPVYRPSSPTLASAPVCPTCKRILPVGAKFCPYDKTRLG